MRNMEELNLKEKMVDRLHVQKGSRLRTCIEYTIDFLLYYVITIRSRRSEGTNATTTSVMLDVKNARKRAEGDLQVFFMYYYADNKYKLEYSD